MSSTGLTQISSTVRRAVAPVALMGFIFWLSDQPDLDTGLGIWDLILRKLGHGVAYGGLALLWWWALRPVSARPLPVAATVTLLYAVSDEYHQSFVEGRSGSPADVGIDLAGIIVAGLLLRYDQRVRSALDGEEP
jgi:VanZ like protein